MYSFLFTLGNSYYNIKIIENIWEKDEMTIKGGLKSGKRRTAHIQDENFGTENIALPLPILYAMEADKSIRSFRFRRD